MGRHNRTSAKSSSAASASTAHGTTGTPSRTGRSGVDLLMECVDEDLAPSQKEANRKAENEYKSAKKKIETVRSQPKVSRVPPTKRMDLFSFVLTLLKMIPRYFSVQRMPINFQLE